MRDDLHEASSMQALGKDAAKSAIRLAGVRKEYRLYNSFSDQALDVLGLAWARFWRPVQYRTFSALDGIDLEIGHGDRVGIVGRNGAGKTTLLKLITGNFAPTSGEIEVGGQVQALMQTGLGFHGEFTGLENIRAAMVYNGLTGGELELAIDDVIDFCELGDFIHQPIKTYSLGMRARLQFAAATAIKPDIVIIDEVLGAGDAYFSAKSANRVERLAKSGCTLLLVSHSVQQILQFCERAIWLDDGRIRMDSTSREVISTYEVEMENKIEQNEKQRAHRAIGPNSAEQQWLDQLVSNQDASEKRNVSPPKEVEIGGRKAFRWPGKDGVKITHVSILQEGEEAFILRSGDDLIITLDLKSYIQSKYEIKYYISVFDLRGNRVAWITSPTDTFNADAGAKRSVSVRLDPLLLGGGDYILSVSIFDSVPENRISARDRHDLLARCLDFKVIENDGRQSPIFHHPARWQFCDNGELRTIAN
jgi:lipopolysaccharide transport system ATP-binding protein